MFHIQYQTRKLQNIYTYLHKIEAHSESLACIVGSKRSVNICNYRIINNLA